ncbi:MAG: 16S rRNA (adenine(1518)-N(6)/adenine(1519)-N(6))-dimethyltransferase RsmA [Christensenellales bacterium]
MSRRPPAGLPVRAKKSLGQHFIHDEALLNALVDLTPAGADDGVFEIGPGLGSLTRVLAARCRRVTALEVDSDLIPGLNVMFSDSPHVDIVQGDVMTIDLQGLLAPLGPLHVIANLPYYITTPILNLLLRVDLPLQSICVTVQREGAARVMAKPSTPEYGPLAVLAQYKTTPQVVRVIPRGSFQPSPNVESVFMVMPFREAPPVMVPDEALFFRIVQAAFSMRRKTLLNNLMPVLGLSHDEALSLLRRAGLREDIRGEALDLAGFADLARAVA